ncbi:response regulator [Microbacterium betulae]|uniref:Response regulator n=1 Tax=Microbacterium betulae TaxID=2981139 RepID=A0AA97FE36_9MICO|nr:response regulator [Microbacterium sp. AB]WOF21866.1 response regulator [Microbacterium sp. AB]
MAIARLHGGPLDGQVLPLENPDLDRLIVPYSETQVVYQRSGAAQNNGADDGPTETAFLFLEEEGDLVEDGEDDEDDGAR